MSSTLDSILEGGRGSAGLIDRLASRFGPLRRRDILMGTAVAGSALATQPRAYALRPMSAYTAVCGPGASRSSGWTVFCCTINKGVNACPPGSFAAGWWKAADSSWCGNGYRYIVDCNASCKCGCDSGGGQHICSRSCWSCSCSHGPSTTCDQRRVCCNAFRYGQCNTHIKCSGGVHCRVVSCIPPYRFDACTTTSLRDDRTAEHNAPCLPSWGPMQKKYDVMGAQRSYLKASTGPIRSVGDRRGRYVAYQKGAIYWTATTGAHAMPASTLSVFRTTGTKLLGYPTADWRHGLPDKGSITLFERGAILDSASTTTRAVRGRIWGVYAAHGRETGGLGYPTGNITITPIRPGQRRDGQVQEFQGGVVSSSPTGTDTVVMGPLRDAWKRSGRERGVLGFPKGKLTKVTRGRYQVFDGGEIWSLTAQPAYRVHGASLADWKARGGAGGKLGFPLTDSVRRADGTWYCRFEGGELRTTPAVPASD